MKILVIPLGLCVTWIIPLIILKIIFHFSWIFVVLSLILLFLLGLAVVSVLEMSQ